MQRWGGSDRLQRSFIAAESKRDPAPPLQRHLIPPGFERAPGFEPLRQRKDICSLCAGPERIATLLISTHQVFFDPRSRFFCYGNVIVGGPASRISGESRSEIGRAHV